MYVLSCTWQAGIRTHELEYAFRLTLPSVFPGPLTEPVVVAGDQRAEFLGDAVTAAMGEMLTITLPEEVTAYTLEGSEVGYEAGAPVPGRWGRSFGHASGIWTAAPQAAAPTGAGLHPDLHLG